MYKIILTQNKVTILDKDDYEKFSKYNWYAAKGKNTFYAQRQIRNGKKRITIHLHKEILNTDKEVDHINGNGLDNRKSNLRTCTSKQNSYNVGIKHKNKTSKFKGVHKTRNNTYEVQIKINYKAISIGRFKNEILAAKHYDAVARFHFGEFANTNFDEIFIEPIDCIELKTKLRKQKYGT